jgi:hypothetical protein
MSKKIIHSTRPSRASGKHHRMDREAAPQVRHTGGHRRDQQAGGPEHKGGDLHEDRNP